MKSWLRIDRCFLRICVGLFLATGAVAPAHAQTFGIYRELWTNLTGSVGNSLAALTNTTLNPNWPNQPVEAGVIATFETATNFSSNYGQRLRAFIVPPVSGAYTFWIASDDTSQLRLSTDETAANAVTIASVNVWTDPRQWTKEPNQQSSAIALQAGRRYYLEALMQEGGGGDNFAVRWRLPNGSFEEPMTATSSAGTRLIPCSSGNVLPGIFVQPASVTVTEHENASFSLLVTNQGPVTYQWIVNGLTLPGAVQPSYALTNADVTLNNGQVYRCVVSNAIGAITSAPAVLTVLGDTQPPTLVSAANFGLTNVMVRFSEPVALASATAITNYLLTPGVTVLSATLYDSQRVLLSVSPLTLQSNYILTVNRVQDMGTPPNAIAANSQVSFTVQAYGLDARPAVGPFLNDAFPEAAPALSGNWSAVVAFTNLVFTNALGLAPIPGTTRLLVWEREGRVYYFANDPAANTKTLVLDIRNQCQGWDDSGLLNIVFHPGFATNRFMYVYYTWVTPGTVVGSPTQRPTEFVVGKYHDRLARFTLDVNGVAVPGSELVLVDQIGDSVWHNGSGMFFHPVNGFLYYVNGDDERAPTQIINQNLFSGVFRIDVDQRGGNISHPIPRQPAKGTTANYYIPNDNPFVGQSGVLEEFYALGLRSPHRMTIDPPSGRIFITDVGAGSREELDVIEPTDPPGLNFQWSLLEGLEGDLTPPYIGVNRRPLLDYSHSDGQAIIGGYIYRGSEFGADLGGKYIFGDNTSRRVWVLDESTSPASKILLCVLPSGTGPNSGSDYTGLSSFGLDHDNELYITQMSSVGGRIYKLARSGPPPASRPFPPLLSQTGAFSDLATLTPSAALIPYAVNSPLWSDGAAKQRWLTLPTNTFIHFSPTQEWTFPRGAVFVKHFALPLDETNPNTLRRLETRFLVRDTNNAVYGITYKWRPDYADADLVTNALTENFVITTAGGTRTQQWFYPGPLDCLRCHTPAAGYVLGLNTRQLNGDYAYPGSGAVDNQLRTLSHIGLFDAPVDEGKGSNYHRLVSVTNTAAPLRERVRSYLDANCSQCHRPGGVPAFWDARYDTPLAAQGIVNGQVGATLGIAGAKVVVPEDITKSILYLRVNTLNSTRMPPLARNEIDVHAVAVLQEWINSLTPPTISPIADVLVTNATTGPISFTVTTASGSADDLVITGSSSNPALVANGNITFGGSGSNRTVTVSLVPNQGGNTTITVSADNGQGIASTTFLVSVPGTLVAHYQLEGNAQDGSGRGNHGAVNGGVTFPAGKLGTGANLNGVSGYVQIPIAIAEDFTIALWVKTTATGGGGQWWAGKGLVDGEVDGASTDFGTALVGGNFAFGMGDPDTTLRSTTAINDGRWHHVAATRSAVSGQMKIYVDGVLEGTGTAATEPRVGPPFLRLGSIQTGTSGGFLAGTLDDVRLYDYVLSASQIGNLANTPPVLAAINDRTIMAGRTLLITNTATDGEAPPQVLTYSLLSPPTGASINASNGVFVWRPAMAQAGTTNLLRVQVADNGLSSQSATQSFLVTVTRPTLPALSNAGLNNGPFQLLIAGDAGPDYVVQASTNLVNWTTLRTTNPVALPFLFTDPDVTNYRERYYRVLLAP